jgi:hypothetical protein
MTDKPSALERLATAVVTSDLTYDPERRVPLDHVIAMGLASIKSPTTSNVLRLYLGQPEAWAAAKLSVLAIVRRLDAKRGWRLSDRDLDRVATSSLHQHINPTCSHCKGRGFEVIPDTPALSAKACRHCHGTGRRTPGRRLRVEIEATIASLEHINSITEAAVRRLLR